MSILQISKIQQRSGNLVDLPQLDEAEFGWASDNRRLFIGKTSPNENVEILTAYSNINFSQISGSYGNLNINPVNLGNGEVLAFDGTNWVNRGGAAGGEINLGNISNVTITGGAIGYVLQTDGLGNLSWTPKSTLVSYIENVSSANPGVLTTVSNHNLSKGTSVTITGAQGMTQLNGNAYYANVLTSNTFSLYSDSGLTTPVNTIPYTSYAFTSVSNTTTGTNYVTVGNSAVLSVNQAVQFVGNMSNTGISSNTTYYINSKPNGTSITISNSIYPNGTAGPILSLSTANGLTANVYQTGGQIVSIVSGGSGAGAAGSNTQIQYNNNGILQASSTLTFDYANNILLVGGNANVANLNSTGIVTAVTLSSNVTTGTAPLTVNSTTKVANLNADLVDGYNTSATTTANTIVVRDANGSISSNVVTANSASLGTLAVTGTSNLGNVGNVTITGGTTGQYLQTNGSGGLTWATVSTTIANISNGTSNVNINSVNGNVGVSVAGTSNVLLVTGTGANVSGYANITGNVIAGNVSGTLLTGTLTTATQPNITSANALANVGNVTAGTWNSAIGASATFAAGLSGANLNFINGANVSTVPSATSATNASAVLQNTSSATTVYPKFTTSSANGNSSAVINTSISANLANASITATTFVGALSGAATSATTATNAINTGVTTQSTGIYYPTFASGNTTSNYALASNPAFSVNLSNGSIIAANFVGNLIGTATSVSTANVTQITNISSGIYYPTFVASSANGNYSMGASSSFSANLSNGSITATTFVGALSGAATSATTAGTVTTNAQPNITSVGTLTALTVTGNVSAGNVNATGNVSGLYFIGNGSQLTGINTGLPNQIVNGNSNVNIASANGNITLSATGTSNVIVVTSTGVNVSGTLNTGSGVITGNGSGLTSLAGSQVVGQVGNALIAGTVTTNAQPNITSVGILTSLAVTGNISGANLTGNHFGNGSGLTNLTGSQVAGTVANSTYATSAGSATTATTAGTVTTNAQPNITSVGILTSLSVTGNITGANITANIFGNGSGLTGSASAFTANNANYLGGYSWASPPQIGSSTANYGTFSGLTVTGTLSGASITATGNLSAANVIATTGVIYGNGSGITSINGSSVTGTVTSSTNAAAVLTTTSSATSAYPTFVTSSANGNSQNYITTGISANLAANSITATTFVGNLTGAASTAGTVTANAQGNITSVGILSNLTVSGGILSGNVTAQSPGFFAGSGFGLTNIPGAQVTGTLGIPTTSYAATVSGNAQGNITSVGTLTGLAVSGNTQIASLGVGTSATGTSGQIIATNNITAYYSDGRLKDVLGTIESPLEKIKQISGVRFTSNDTAAKYGYTDKKVQIGVIAQEIEAILPEIVVPAPFDMGTDDDGNPISKSGENYKTVHYDKIIPLLIEAIKEQQKQIEELQSRISNGNS